MTETDRHDLVEITVADDAGAWTAAGFAVDAGCVAVGPTTIRLLGERRPRGIRSVSVEGIGRPVDGIPFGPAAGKGRGPAAPRRHPNDVVAIDHLVVLSPDMDRTTAALETNGLGARRTRRFEVDGVTRRQTFFWLGRTILELVGADDIHDEGPATVFGLAFTCDDLDAAATALGDGLGPVKPAVQRDRHIATLRTRDLGISVPIALMSPHPAGTGR